MPTRALLCLAACVVAVGVSACDSSSESSPAAGPDNRQVTVVGEGEVQGTPDTFTVNFSIVSIAATAIEATNQTNERQQAVINALTANGIDQKDVSTTDVSLQPEVGPDFVAITGYEASNSIEVTVRAIDNASQTIDLITNTGGNQTRIDSASYSIDDDSQLVKDARARAFEDAKARAEQYAQLSGLTLGKVISISESGGAIPPPPTPYAAPTEADAAIPLAPGEQTVGFAVTVVWELG